MKQGFKAVVLVGALLGLGLGGQTNAATETKRVQPVAKKAQPVAKKAQPVAKKTQPVATKTDSKASAGATKTARAAPQPVAKSARSGGKPAAAGAGMLAQSRQEVFLRWNHITKVKYKPKSRTILLRGGWTEQIALFCADENYPQIEHEVMLRTTHLRKKGCR